MEVGIVGLGLIGGSIALNLSQGLSVVGYDADPTISEYALSQGVVADVASSFEQFANARLIFIACPPQAVAASVEQLSPFLHPEAVVTDTAGIKVAILKQLETSENNVLDRFVGGHPMAGREVGGIRNARIDLFEGSSWILTPGPNTGEGSLERVAGTVSTFGANPVCMTATDHDAMMALVSQVPHVLAAALLQQASSTTKTLVTGGSWEDLTRVGGADPVLWSDLVLLNRHELSYAIAELIKGLTTFNTALDGADDKAVFRFFQDALQAKHNHRT